MFKDLLDRSKLSWRWMGCLALGAVAACGSDSSGSTGSTTGGGTAVCLLVDKCTADADCSSGAHCNLALSPPQCEKLYCDARGAACSEAATCTNGLGCTDGRCCSYTDDACETADDCCSAEVAGFNRPQTCEKGVCVKGCLPEGQSEGFCEDDQDCCAGLTCSTETNFCVKASACGSCNDWLAIAGTPDSALCEDALTFLNSMVDCGCQSCSLECTNSTMCSDPFVAVVGDMCKGCMTSHCLAELTACSEH